MKGRKDNGRERTDGRKGADRRVAVRSRGCDPDEYRRDDSETVGTGMRASRGAGQDWLATARPYGRPHVMPVLAVWMDGALYVSTRPSSRKGKNLAHDPHCVITFATDDLDVVVEGEAAKVTGDAKVDRVADAFASKYEWHFAVRDGVAYDESLPGPLVYGFYEVKPTRAFGYGADGMTATRWRFQRAQTSSEG